jgi:hypothetical protein
MTTVGFIGSGNLGGTVARLAVAFSQRTFLPFGHGATAMMGQTITTTCQDRAIELPLEQVHDSVARSRSATG